MFTLTQPKSQNISSFNQGSPNVGEEEAETFTLGVVFTPEALPNLSVALDYYDIKTEDAISVPTGTEILNRCHDVAVASFAPTCGGLEFRDPTAGHVLDVSGVANNEDTIHDLAVSYYFDQLAGGDLTVSLGANYLDEYTITGISGDKQEQKGEVLFPELRFNINLAYSLNNFSVFSQLRYRDDTVAENEPTHNANLNEINSAFYVDLRGSYQIYDTLNIFVGANNLFDRDPERLVGTQTEYYHSGTETNGTAFDTTGRQWYAGVKLTF